MELKSLCLGIVLLPLLASLIVGLRIKSIKVAHSVTVFSVGVSFLLSCLIFYKLVWGGLSSTELSLYTWGQLGNTNIQLGFLIDRLSALMMVVVNFVSLMVHIYTIGYMRGDPGYARFFCYISAFTFGMLMLVMSNNFVQLFFGWEAVGLMSYLLIGFWYQKQTAISASLKAFLVNRVGDMGFVIGIAAIYFSSGVLDYVAVFERIDWMNTNHPNLITFICLCLFIGAMGKSAQMPLHVWLPDSMEGPTPISALIHAATMVTAGVFMVARMSPLFEQSEFALTTVMTIGSLTCLFTGLLGCVQSDIKRIIAYSTLSQLGYMMMAMGASAYNVGIFHLMTHAFFKALLFLGAGSVIIALHHEQSIWNMGGLRRYMPVTYVTMLIGSLALIGFPFFSGFYSKELIIEALQHSNLSFAKVAYWVATLSVFVTALYTFRLFFVVFHGQERMDSHTKSHLHESPKVVIWPLILLAIPSILSGAIFLEPLTEFFQTALVQDPHHTGMTMDQNWQQMGVMGFQSLPVMLGLSGIFTAWICYLRYPMLPKIIANKLQIFYRILEEKYGFDLFYQSVLVRLTRALGFILWKISDQLAIDGICVNGSAHSVRYLGRLLRKLQTGYLYHYAFIMVLGFLILWVLLVLA